MPSLTVLQQQLKQDIKRRTKVVLNEFQPRNLFLLPDVDMQQALLQRDKAFLMSIGSAPMRWMVIHRPSSLNPLIEKTKQRLVETQASLRPVADLVRQAWSQPGNIEENVRRLLEQRYGLPAERDQYVHAFYEQNRLIEYREFFKQFQKNHSILTSRIGLAVWKDYADPTTPIPALKGLMFQGHVKQGKWPQLLDHPESYVISDAGGIWHMEPVGYPAGRPYVCFLRAYDWVTSVWRYHEPWNSGIIPQRWPFAIVWDVPHTYEKQNIIADLEEVKDSSRTGLIGRKGTDSATEAKLLEINQTLGELTSGAEAVHRLRVRIALFADSPEELKARVEYVSTKLATHMKIAVEQGAQQKTAYKYFTTKKGLEIEGIGNTHPVTTSVLALSLGPTGMPMPEADGEGILYGTNELQQPIFLTHWARGKKPALHTTIVGKTGSGKTFFTNLLLQRSWIFEKTPFTLIEPLGHGRKLAKALGIQAFTIDPTETVINPLDPVYKDKKQQIEHATGLIEMLIDVPLNRTTDDAVLQGLLGAAVRMAYGHDVNMETLQPSETPILSDVINSLKVISESDAIPIVGGMDLDDDTRRSARKLAIVLEGKMIGAFGYFTNGRTKTNYSLQNADEPRIYCLDKIGASPVLIALTYLQIFAKEWRMAVSDENPRNLVLDEVARLNVHPALPVFITRVAKTLRTVRGRLIVIDQDIDTFLTQEMQQVFSNCPWHIYFNQSGNETTYETSPRFNNWSKAHTNLLSKLQLGQYLLEHPDLGITWMYAQPTPHELQRFGKS